MVSDRAKKPKPADGAGEADNDHIDSALIHSIEKLQEVQDELEKVNYEASEKVLEVEQKYTVVRRPVYARRSEIIRKIPGFWSTAFLSHPALDDFLTDEDHEIFKYLDDIEVEDFEDVRSGYSITLTFKGNPYFEDTKLTKTFTFLDEGITKISGTTIKWKEGMGIFDGDDHKKEGKKRSLDEDSFFTWFSSNTEKELAMMFHNQLGDIIKEDLWPNPLKYFSNETDEEDSEGDDADDEQGKDDDEDSEKADG